MIIISASFRKSASTLIFDYTRELVATNTSNNSLMEIRKYSTGKGYRGKLDFKTFLILLYLNFRFGDVVLKTHGKPTFYVRLLVTLGLARVTYSFRDPRDVILSMIDHGIRTRKQLNEQGKELNTHKNFSDIYSVHDALEKVSIDVENWYAWKSFKKILLIKYEDFIFNKFSYLQKIDKYLGYKTDEQNLKSIYDTYDKKNTRNFNKGTANRYLKEMSHENMSLCNNYFYQSLKDMKYI